ncbi:MULTISPECIES: SRPBCC family protein [unclassified Caulobacter]|uniref:SRPBCC family protein n=1 Tax=unclassified Caulobacter TaxID=2648921 RepID=UPI000D36026D|nr:MULTISPECIES: SRPBCC family protein [unclassified Caulobacter]PTS87239.1 ATPase [Caulobacter sp. HMWF009]PTT12467.1 ATPase [Caulobacter sp. HMWF025]
MAGMNKTVVVRKSDLELVVTRLFDGPVELVFEAWSRADLFQRWWVPKALGVPLRACEMDVRTGGGYRLEFGLDAANAMAFYGTYTDVTPPSRIVWTNEESGEITVTTVMFEDQGGKTLLTLSELYPSKAACDEALQGSAAGLPLQFEQLDELLAEGVA